MASDPDTLKLTTWQLTCLNALSLPIAMAGLVVITLIPTYYATDLGLGLAGVGFVFVVGRLMDVVTDPLLGFFSDQTRSRLGARLPYILLGLPLFCVAVWMLFLPPEAPSLTYLIIAGGFYFLFYTVLDVPYSSVALEISPFAHERSVIASFKSIFQVVGAISAALIPFILVGGVGQALPVIAKFIFALSVICIVLFLLFVPRRHPVSAPTKVKLLPSLKTAWRFKPYRHLISTFFTVQVANSLTAGLTMLFLTHVIGRGDIVGLALAIIFASSAMFLPLWVFMSKRYGKSFTWRTAMCISIFALGLVPFLGTGDLIPALILCVLIGGTFGCDAIMPTSMLADMVYKSEAQSEAPTAGLYLAMKNALSKLTFIAPMGLAFPVLDLVNFNTDGETDAGKLFVLVTFYAIIPLLLRAIAVLMISKMPAYFEEASA